MPYCILVLSNVVIYVQCVFMVNLITRRFTSMAFPPPFRMNWGTTELPSWKGFGDHLIGSFVYRWGNWGPDKGGNLPKVTQLLTDSTVTRCSQSKVLSAMSRIIMMQKTFMSRVTYRPNLACGGVVFGLHSVLKVGKFPMKIHICFFWKAGKSSYTWPNGNEGGPSSSHPSNWGHGM